jgi:putative acetyltransferase
VIVREQRPRDETAVRQVLTAAFDDRGQVADLARTLAARADRPSPDCVLVAESEGTVVGHVQLSRGWIGIPAVFLEGDPAYYARMGWERAGAHGFTAPSPRIPPAGFQVVRLPAWQSWMVGPVVYNDTFWTSDFVGLRSHS